MPEMFKKIREAVKSFPDSKLSLEAVRKTSSESAKKILTRPTKELKEALKSRVPRKKDEIDQLNFSALFDQIRLNPATWEQTKNDFIDHTVGSPLGFAVGDPIRGDINADWYDILNPEPAVQILGNVASVIEAFATGDRDALQQAITPLVPADIVTVHETIGLLLERFWSGRVVVELQGVPGLPYITNRQFVGNLESFHAIFDRINGDPQRAMESLEQVVPEAAEVNNLAEEIGSMVTKLMGSSLQSYLDPFKSMLGSGLQRGAIEPKDITPFMIELKKSLTEIKAEQDEEKQKALLGQLGKKIKEGFPKLLSGAWDKIKAAGGLLGTGLLVWGAAFAFYLPIYLMDMVKEVKPFGK